MTVAITFQFVVFATSLLLGWTIFLLSAIKWLLNRQLIGIESKIVENEKMAIETLNGLNLHKESSAKEMTKMQLDFHQKPTCTNHNRMEDNDGRLFKRMDSLHGDMREMLGEMNRVIHTLELLNNHHLGEK